MSRKTRTTKKTINSEILASLSVEAMIAITPQMDLEHFAFVVSTGGGSSPLAIAMDTPPRGAISNFVITMYEYNGSNQAKLSLQAEGSPSAFWVAGPSPDNWIILGPTPGQFVLTDVTGNGAITIQNTFSPPDTYIHGPVGKIMTYGYKRPLLVGVFNIQVVG
jgi:hypothetical protein